jgi:hypothetical protein
MLIKIATPLLALLFFAAAPHLRADEPPPIDIDQFNSCTSTKQCVKVETDVCCSPTSINRKKRKKYQKLLYSGKAHVPCGCVKSNRKPKCVHGKCFLPELDLS